MPESVTTDNVAVARLLAAAELVKITPTGATASRSPEALASAFKTIYKAMGEARAGK